MGKASQVRIRVTWATTAEAQGWGERGAPLSGVRLEKPLGRVARFIRRVCATWTETRTGSRTDGVTVSDLVHAEVITAN